MERSFRASRPRRRLLRREVSARYAEFAVVSCALAGPAAAQEGGVVAEFCKNDRYCVDDALEIVFESGSSTYEGTIEPGVEVPIRVVLDTKSPDIQGYSWAVKHDGEFLTLIAESVTTAGTIIDPESPDTAVKGEYFGVHRAVEGGFISAVVLSLLDNATLPVGRNAICHAAYRIAAVPECTVIRFVDRQLAVPRSPFVSLVLSVRGLSKEPRVFRHGLLRSGACPETCDDLADNDGDGLADCEDPECAIGAYCTRETACKDGIDNDGDGKVDCKDESCAQTIGACGGFEDCTDGLDNNENGAIDCADAYCAHSAPCRDPEICGDGADNDRDSLIDCDDHDCWALPTCQAPEVCDDATDNDRDGLVDCADSDCQGRSTCVEVCDDGADNDRDGYTDCGDPDCRGDVACLEKCDDGIDNDLDSLTDCHDRDCSGVGGCPEFEACGDGRDNDEDGLTDCADPECRWQNPCVEVCDDSIDNDGDGFVDGLDRDCFPDEVVIPGGAPPLPSAFLRGDADGDGRLTVLDALLLIQIVTRAQDPRDDCREALNPDADEGINLADPVYVVRWIFLDGPPPPPPFPACEFSSGWCGSSRPGCR